LKPRRDAAPEKDSRLRKSDSIDGLNDINLMAGINSKLKKDLSRDFLRDLYELFMW
jgi:hypothetical protein